TKFYYDWRDRLVMTIAGFGAPTGTHAPITYNDLDNLGEATTTRQFDGDGITTVTYTSGVPDAPSAGLLRAKTMTSFDDQGRIYRTNTYSVDNSGTVLTNTLATNTYYDH